MCIVSYEAKAWKFFIPMWYTLHKEWTQLVSYQCDKKVLQGHCPLSQYTLSNMKNAMVWLLHRTACPAVLVNFQLPSDRAFYAPSFPSHGAKFGSSRVCPGHNQVKAREKSSLLGKFKAVTTLLHFQKMEHVDGLTQRVSMIWFLKAIHRLSSNCGRIFMCFVFDPASVHSPKTKHNETSTTSG